MALAQEVSPFELPDEIHATTLKCLLSNHLILCHTLPYLPPSALLNLAATSHEFRGLIYNTPLAFRHLDLTQVKTAQFEISPIDSGGELWHNTQLDEHLTEDEFYSGPLRGIFSNLSRAQLLSSVQTLILDGLSVTAELVHDILTGPSFNIRILSLRDVKNLNERKLQQALRTACRPTRPDGTPRLKALYLFSQRDGNPPSSPCSGSGVAAEWSGRSQQRLAEQEQDGDGDAWYGRRGKMLTRTVQAEWAATLIACRGIISFDTVLCAGPRHLNSPAYGKAASFAGSEEGSGWAVATHALDGCAGCGSAPEGATIWGRSRSEGDGGEYDYPLLAPAPLHSSSLKVARCPSGVSLEHSALLGDGYCSSPWDSEAGTFSKQHPRFIARCSDCLKDRYCWSCHKWWCEDCYAGGALASSQGGIGIGIGIGHGHGHGHGHGADSNNKVRIDGLCGDC